MAIDFEKFRETLPYAAELFGVYQPLLGWKSKRKLIRLRLESDALLEAALIDMRKHAPSLKDIMRVPRPVGPDDLVPAGLPRSLSTRVARQFRSAAMRFFQQHGRAPEGEEWQQIVQQANFQKVLNAVARESKRAARAATSQTPFSLKEEAVTAGALMHMAAISPDTLKELMRVGPAFSSLMRGAVDPLANFDPTTQQAVLSPIGLVHLYREYFFEFDSFLGPPVGHVWVSPGGSLEVFEIHTRKTVEERQVEIATETTTRSEKEVVDEDEISTAIGEQNARNINFGVSASASGDLFGVVEVSASASFGMQFNHQTSEEHAHRHARKQSETLSNEIRRNFKTTFRTSVETQDTSSRRYVLQNTTDKLVNYELRRKMRQVGVQVQHIGTQLCWQTYVDEPGFPLGIAMLVHVAQPDDFFPSEQPPEAPPKLEPKKETVPATFPFNPLDDEARDDGGDEEYHHGHDVNEDAGEGLIEWKRPFRCSPPTGYKLVDANITNWAGSSADEDQPSIVAAEAEVLSENKYQIILNEVNFEDQPAINFTVELIYEPPEETAEEKAAFEEKKKKFEAKQQATLHAASIKLLRERIKLASNIRPRAAADLRDEERSVIYRQLIRDLSGIKDGPKPHLMAELIRAIFDVEKMLYFVAQDWWRPRVHYRQRFGEPTKPTPEDIVSWGGVWANIVDRPNYMITEDSEPARMGASLGWMLQLDGDTHRNAFLNSPWVKAIIPIRPGKEVAAINWLRLAHVEGTEGLDAAYGGTVEGKTNPTIEDAVMALAESVHDLGTDINNTLATETVFEHGFDPLETGFQATGTPFEVFDQWIEVLPTDQVVAVEYNQPADQ